MLILSSFPLVIALFYVLTHLSKFAMFDCALIYIIYLSVYESRKRKKTLSWANKNLLVNGYIQFGLSKPTKNMILHKTIKNRQNISRSPLVTSSHFRKHPEKVITINNLSESVQNEIWINSFRGSWICVRANLCSYR